MKNFIVITLMAALPKQSIHESIVVALPNNAIPIGIEVRPASFPEGLFIHHLIPCDDEGNPVEETPPYIFEVAWKELYKLYGERLDQDNLDVMESVIKGILLDRESEVEAKGDGEKT